MFCFKLKETDPYYCLAAEEFLLKSCPDNVFMLWQSHNTVIVGKHQNALAEINYRYVRENDIKVARRISGGGTVFHDTGNVNFVFIKNVSSPSEISFRMFLEPMADFLKTLGILAEISGRNDLLVESRKVSGNAQHVYKNRVLHHGTLLFDSSLQTLGNAIRGVPARYTGKAVQSNRSPVANLRDFLKTGMTTAEFTDSLLRYQLSLDPENRLMEFTEADSTMISGQAAEKFATWDWCFGYSPGYVFRNELEIDRTDFLAEFKVERGIITESRCKGRFPFTDKLNNAMCGRKHRFEEIKEALQLFFPDFPGELTYGFF